MTSSKEGKEGKDFNYFTRKSSVELSLPASVPEDVRSFLTYFLANANSRLDNIKFLLAKNKSLAKPEIAKRFLELLRSIKQIFETEQSKSDPTQQEEPNSQLSKLAGELNKQEFKKLILNFDFSDIKGGKD